MPLLETLDHYFQNHHEQHAWLRRGLQRKRAITRQLSRMDQALSEQSLPSTPSPFVAQPSGQEPEWNHDLADQQHS